MNFLHILLYLVDILLMGSSERVLNGLNFDDVLDLELKYPERINNDHGFHCQVTAFVGITLATFDSAATKMNFVISWSGNYNLFRWDLLLFFNLLL